MHSIQHYVIKLDSDLRLAGGFLRLLRFPLLIQLTMHHEIADILLKVMLNVIAITQWILTDQLVTVQAKFSYNSFYILVQPCFYYIA